MKNSKTTSWRKWFTRCVLVTLCCLCCGEDQVTAASAAHINTTNTIRNLQTHVNYLSASALAGRLTGSRGEKLATQYVATFFRRLGFEPAGDHGTFFQAFYFVAGVTVGKRNTLVITKQNGESRKLLLHQEWRPLAFSDATSFVSTELIFVGYGITAPAQGKLPAYDSYHGVSVKDKWVVVFKYLPEKLSRAERQQLRAYSSLRYKAFTAAQHGAKGIIYLNAPDAKNASDLMPIAFDQALSGCGITALSVNNKVIDDLLMRDNQPLHSLQAMHAALDNERFMPLPLLRGVHLAGQIDIKRNIQQGRNVLARLKIAANNTRLIVVGAHVDHLGHGEWSGSRARNDERGMIHPGADDNASGVAAILETARHLKELQAHGQLHGNKDILFAAWSGEEFGILGSSHFVLHFLATKAIKSLHPTIDAAINLDMVGHLREKLVVQGVSSSTDWRQMIARAKTAHSVTLLMQADPYLPTDSTAFYLHGVPILNLFTGAHQDYHTPRDKAETLNYVGINKISAFLLDMLLTLEKRSKPLAFHAVLKTSHRVGRAFRNYLGTIPDYASTNVVGVKLAGVAQHSPAELAGVKAGDVVIVLAGKQIHDIYDYTYALNALMVNTPVNLIVRRGQNNVVLTIVARYRE